MLFFLYEDKVKEWRWRLISKNGRVIADSGESYATNANGVRAINMIRSAFDDIARATILEPGVGRRTLVGRPTADSNRLGHFLGLLAQHVEMKSRAVLKRKAAKKR